MFAGQDSARRQSHKPFKGSTRAPVAFRMLHAWPSRLHSTITYLVPEKTRSRSVLYRVILYPTIVSGYDLVTPCGGIVSLFSESKSHLLGLSDAPISYLGQNSVLVSCRKRLVPRPLSNSLEKEGTRKRSVWICLRCCYSASGTICDPRRWTRTKRARG